MSTPKKKKGPGRPIKEGEEKATENLHLRLTPTQDAAFKEAAADEWLDSSAWARKQLQLGVEAARRKREATLIEILKIVLPHQGKKPAQELLERALAVWAGNSPDDPAARRDARNALLAEAKQRFET